MKTDPVDDVAGEPPPPGVRTMAIVRWVLLALTVLVAVGSWYGFARGQLGSSAAPAVTMFQCPMHPQIIQDHPGECPICHMDLEPVAKGASASAAAGTGAVMPPSSPSSLSSAPATPSPSASGALPPNTAPVHLALDRAQAIGVRTAVVTEQTMARALRVTASVLPTEQGLARVHVRTPGFVEQVAANAAQTGIRVERGQLLFSMYSPEIFQAQSELLAASQWAETPASASALPDGAPRAAGSARRKLELLGMSAKDIERVVRSKEPLRAVPVYAPMGGVITKKDVVLGSYVTPEMTLYELQDFSKVYVVADVFPKDVAAIKKGMKGRFTLGRGPQAPIEATVDLVYPVVDTAARTTRVRLTVKNVGLDLRPGDFGTVELDAPAARVLAVPRDAVVDTGKVAYVFVVGSDGVFRPQVVTLEGEDGERAFVRSGVAAGERVVSGATFLIDSESRLQAALHTATTPAPSTPAPPAPAPAAPGKHQHP